ncbi:hypothetical protein CRG98_007775 [Punica granatum]|uniref:Uncharacterized protein n=1 Tax=Punica granatum TaxID=22663 RepID=A0A2I0KVH0_PUNGR|nr:hypothetical protein CRG98_007775 [Punica granatum]
MDVRMLECAATNVGGRQVRGTSRQDVREHAGARQAERRRADARAHGWRVSAREEEEEAETFGTRGGCLWATRGPHSSRGKTGRKLGSRLVTHSKFVVRIERRIVDMHGKMDLMSPRLTLSVKKCPESV